MICSICGRDEVMWMGSFSNLTHTECKNCAGVNCQVPDPDKEEEQQEEEINPPLDCAKSDWLKWFNTLKEGDRVIEMGSSCMTGKKGTIVIVDGVKCIKWDAFDDGSVLTTTVTGGARLIND